MSLFTSFFSSRASCEANSKKNGGEELAQCALAITQGENPVRLLKTMANNNYWHLHSAGNQIEKLTPEEAQHLIFDLLAAKRREMGCDPEDKVGQDYVFVQCEENLTHAKTGFSQSVKEGFAWAVGKFMDGTFSKVTLTPRQNYLPKEIELDKIR